MSGRLVPRGIRNRLLVAVLASVAVALAAMIAVFNVVLDRHLSHEAGNIAQTRARAQLGALRVENGRLVESEIPDDAAANPLVWVLPFRGPALEAPRVGEDVDRAARGLARGGERFEDIPAAQVRLFALPVVSEGRRVGTVVSGVSLEPYQATKRAALIDSIVLAAALLGIVGLAARWTLSSALRPVSRMTAEADAWSERDLDRRFRLGRPHDELTRLAATLDGLLDRLAASMRREQRFSAELSHELRTPLSRISAEVELALRRERESSSYRETLEAIGRDAKDLSRALDTLVAAARQEGNVPRGTADAGSAAEAAIDACSPLAEERGVEVVLEAPTPSMRIGVDADVAERILQPLVENACRYGRSNVLVSVARDTNAIVFTIRDDGPGVAEAEREEIFDPGRRGTAAGNGHGAGLGLALARRLARAAGGDVSAQPDGEGGAFSVRLPTA